MAQIKLTVKGLNKLIANYEKRANALNARQMVALATAAVESQAKALTQLILATSSVVLYRQLMVIRTSQRGQYQRT